MPGLIRNTIRFRPVHDLSGRSAPHADDVKPTEVISGKVVKPLSVGPSRSEVRGVCSSTYQYNNPAADDVDLDSSLT